MSELSITPGPIEIPIESGAVLRQTTPADAPMMLDAFRANRKRLRSAKLVIPRTLDEVQRRIDVFNSGRYKDFVILAGGDVAGEITLMPYQNAPTMAEISYWLDKDHIGLGHASTAIEGLSGHAFGALGFSALVAEVDIENRYKNESMQALERAGFKRYGGPTNRGRSILFVLQGGGPSV